MDQNQLNKTKTKLLGLVPLDGTAIGNGQLRERLDLRPEVYQLVVDALVD